MLFWLLGISVIGIPLAILYLYLLNGTIRIEEELDHREQFVADFRSGKLPGK